MQRNYQMAPVEAKTSTMAKPTHVSIQHKLIRSNWFAKKNKASKHAPLN